MGGPSTSLRAMPTARGKEFWSALELADLSRKHGVRTFPQTKRGVCKYASSNGWNTAPDHLCRKRASRGGGLEYHYTLLPKTLWHLIEGVTRDLERTSCHAIEQKNRSRQIEALNSSCLSARARSVMEARSAVLTAIEGYAIAQGQKRSWAVGKFLKAQETYEAQRQIETRRADGEALTGQEASLFLQACPLRSDDGFAIDPQHLARACDKKTSSTVKRATLYNWFKVRDTHGLAALSPGPPKVAGPLPEGFAEFLKYYAKPSKPSASDALSEYLRDNPTSRLTLDQVRHVLRHRMNNIEKNVGREGLLTLRARLPYVTRTTEGMWPTTIYTADGKTFDAEIEDPVTYRPIRPEITTVLDVVTRKVVGIALSRSENTIAVTEALRNACVGHGIPAIFYVDRGPGYKNKAFDADVGGLMGRLGITKMHAAPYGSQAKGRIERPNATIWDVLAKRLPTYIGKDMDMEASKFIHKKTRKEIAEVGRSRLLPSWDEFVTLCEEQVAAYNAKPHRGLPRFRDEETGRLRHLSPDEAWAAHVANGFEHVAVSEGEVDDLFRPYEMRTCRRSEVQWHTNTYFDPSLRNYHGKKVMVGYDYQQADKVWVREFDVSTGQPGPLICVAGFMANAERYVPRSFQEEAEERRAAGRLKRHDDKRQAIEDERLGLTLVEHEEMRQFDLSILTEEELVPINAAPERGASGGLSFSTDEQLAAWALEHPDALTASQIEILRDCMSRSTARDVFRMSGIDTEALETLLRAVA